MPPVADSRGRRRVARVTGPTNRRRRDLISVPKERAAQLAGITMRQLNYWDDHDVTHPAVTRHVGNRVVKLYGYPELISLQVAAELRGRQSLQEIRALVVKLREEGHDEPLRTVRYAFDQAGHLYFDRHGSGDWEGHQQPGHLVIAQVLDLQPMHERIARGLERRAELHGLIERHRGVMSNQPVFAGTRIPVAAVRNYLADGADLEEILDAYPVLSERDVAVAIG